MHDTTSRNGPSPNTELNSVKVDQHQLQSTSAIRTAEPAPPAPEETAGHDLTTILVLAVVLAIAVRVFWKALLGLAVIAGLALVFAGILVPVMMMAPPR